MLIDFTKHQDKIFNPLVGKLQKASKRYVVSYGGAGSSKSYSQTQHEIIRCLQRHEKLLVIRKVNSTLKDSVISLFKSILNSWGMQSLYEENKTDQNITFVNGSQILFKGLDDPEKIKSIAGITRVWVEEATELSQQDFQQLNLRLRGRNDLQLTITFNPIDSEHWVKSFFFDNPTVREKTEIIKTTYLDNKFIDDTYKEVLESYKDIDKNYYKIYALGEFGGITEGRIYPAWVAVDKFPEIPKWYGLDFGYTNDPTAIVRTGTANGRTYFEEVCYQTGLTNPEIAELLFASGYNNEAVFCDSAEPKSIEELIRCGINAYPANKGPGSIMAGIDKLRASKCIICGYSPNLERENKYYQWKELTANRQTPNKRFDNTPKDWMNHLMDACRYAHSWDNFNSGKDSMFMTSDML